MWDCLSWYLSTGASHVAIKELFVQSASDEVVTEFENEARIMGRLRSDYLVQFYGCCLSPKYCLVMEIHARRIII